MTKKTAILAAILIPVLFVVTIFNTFKTKADKNGLLGVTQHIETSKAAEKDNKIKILSEFFKKNHSPLEAHAKQFVETADKYNLDYRLLPAISCTESSCGKFLIPDSHNPFGWGIYGTTVTKFKSYDEAIEKVGEGLSKGYIARGLDTPEKIAPVYTPPSYIHWSAHTRWFMNQMDLVAANVLTK